MVPVSSYNDLYALLNLIVKCNVALNTRTTVVEITVGHWTLSNQDDYCLNILVLIKKQSVLVENCLEVLQIHVNTPVGCYCPSKSHKCLIKITFVQTMCLSILYCLFQVL